MQRMFFPIPLAILLLKFLIISKGEYLQLVIVLTCISLKSEGEDFVFICFEMITFLFLRTLQELYPFKKRIIGPGWCSSVDWAQAVNQRVASPVQFPVRAHAWVVGQIPSRGCMRGNHTLMFLPVTLFLLPLPSL